MCGVAAPIQDGLKGVTDTVMDVSNKGVELGKQGFDMAKDGTTKVTDVGMKGFEATKDLAGKATDTVSKPLGDVANATVMKIPGADAVKEAGEKATSMTMDALPARAVNMVVDGTKTVSGAVVDGASKGVSVVGEATGGLMGNVEEAFSKLGAAAGFQSIFDGFGAIDKSDEGLAKLFASVDTDGSGKISEDEMKKAIEKAYGKALDDKVLKEMMAAADTNNDGEIDVTAWRAGTDGWECGWRHGERAREESLIPCGASGVGAAVGRRETSPCTHLHAPLSPPSLACAPSSHKPIAPPIPRLPSLSFVCLRSLGRLRRPLVPSYSTRSLIHLRPSSFGRLRRSPAARGVQGHHAVRLDHNRILKRPPHPILSAMLLMTVSSLPSRLLPPGHSQRRPRQEVKAVNGHARPCSCEAPRAVDSYHGSLLRP